MEQQPTLSDKVTEWLDKTGFPLEMEAAAAFRAVGFDVRQSSVFPDPQSDKGREIDVLAQDPDLVGIIDISFVIECKSSTKPWVVFTAEDVLSGYNQYDAFGVISDAARGVLAGNILNGRTILTNYIMRSAKSGYGFRQALGNESDLAYTAAMGVLKACHGIAQDRAGSSIPRWAFAFPIIVVDSPLFECARGEDGALVLTEVQRSEFLFSAYIPNHIGCCIKVITKEQLLSFAKWAKQLANAIREELVYEECELLRSL